MEIVANKLTIRIGICEFQASCLTCLKMALMLLGMMVPSEELREEENENEQLEEVSNHPHPLSQTWGLCGKAVML